MTPHFKVKKITNVSELKDGDELPESDFCFIEDSKVIQLKYVEEEYETPKTIVKPGIWTIKSSNHQLVLEKAKYTEEPILDSFLATKEATDKIECFFKKLPVYKELGLLPAKRAMLFHGPAGTGKSSLITKAVRQYSQLPDFAIVNWPSDKYNASDVKDFIQSFKYEGVEKFILIIEDLGGFEADQVQVESKASLLSLLANQEETFSLPTLILATTNFPENFLGNITNRPQRFDDKIEVGYPKAEARRELLKFFSKDTLSDSVLNKITGDKFKQFTPAHLKEIIVRSRIYDKSESDVMEEMAKEIEQYNKSFSTTQKLGISSTPDYD